jgi:hypothetical protein
LHLRAISFDGLKVSSTVYLLATNDDKDHVKRVYQAYVAETVQSEDILETESIRLAQLKWKEIGSLMELDHNALTHVHRLRLFCLELS